MRENIYQNEIDQAFHSRDAIRAIIAKLRKRKPKLLDYAFHSLHEETFKEVDCLACANCCKTTSPLFQPTDVERAAKALRMKPQKFIDTYLREDEDGDIVLQSSPCPFLGGDNYCLIYKHRPTACREYPHTNRKRMHQILKITEKNALICPAVSRILTKIEAQF